MDTNKMRSELRVSAERAVASSPPGGDGNPFPAIAVRAVDVLALFAEIERREENPNFRAVQSARQDAEIKRLTALVEELHGHTQSLEQEMASLRGSCKSLGDDLRRSRSASTAARRALSWYMAKHPTPLEGLPGWLARTLTAVIEHDKRPIERKEASHA